MKKIEKGTFGYLSYRKKKLGIITLLCFAMVAAFFLVGYLSTKTKENLFTIMAILSVLPAGKFAATFFTLLPYQSASTEQYQRVKEHANNILLLSDLIITTGEKTLPTLFMAVHNGSVCGFANAEKYDITFAEQFLSKNLTANGQKAAVKIFKEEKAFLKRLDTMQTIETEEKQKKKDHRIGEILLTLVV